MTYTRSCLLTGHRVVEAQRVNELNAYTLSLTLSQKDSGSQGLLTSGLFSFTWAFILLAKDIPGPEFPEVSASM